MIDDEGGGHSGTGVQRRTILYYCMRSRAHDELEGAFVRLQVSGRSWAQGGLRDQPVYSSSSFLKKVKFTDVKNTNWEIARHK